MAQRLLRTSVLGMLTFALLLGGGSAHRSAQKRMFAVIRRPVEGLGGRRWVGGERRGGVARCRGGRPG
jgi:hypothetical protein